MAPARDRFFSFSFYVEDENTDIVQTPRRPYSHSKRLSFAAHPTWSQTNIVFFILLVKHVICAPQTSSNAHAAR